MPLPTPALQSAPVRSLVHVLLAAIATAAPQIAAGQDFGFAGEGEGLTGSTSAIGPIAPVIAWSAPETSRRTYAPIVSDGRVFVVREGGASAVGRIVALDLATGTELWRRTLPRPSATIRGRHAISGVRDGVVYATRSEGFGCFAQGCSPVYALDAATGGLIWESSFRLVVLPTAAGGFSPDGHPIVAGLADLVCLDKATGALIWQQVGSGISTGVAVVGNTVTAFENLMAQIDMFRCDATTGVRLPATPDVTSFFEQFYPVVDAEQNVYIPLRSDFCDLAGGLGELQAYRPVPTGDFPLRWTTSILCSPLTQLAIDRAGFLYTISAGARLRRHDPATGAVLLTSASLGADLRSAKIIVDGAGFLYLHNPTSSSPTQRLRVFDSNLQEIPFPVASMPFTGAMSSGGIAIAGDGYLLLSDLGGITAFRAPSVGLTYCSPSVANSTGASARLRARGSEMRAHGDLVLRAERLPLGSTVLMLNARDQVSIPGAGGSLGVLCLGGGIGPFTQDLRTSSTSGNVDLRVDLSAQPRPAGAVSVMAGETWHYQAWYRDAVGGSAVSNLTDAVTLLFN